MTPRVLFVDDDEHLLAGLRRTLTRRAPRVTAVFALGGAAAVRALDSTVFDAVVSDMRMPDMDGADVLDHARTRQPTALRMLLSGFTDHDSMLRVLPLAHQLFSKPIDVSALLARIDQGCKLRAYVEDAGMRASVCRLMCLPSAPSIHTELTELLGAPEVDFRTIANVVARDPAMTLRVLQLASSSFFNIERPIVSIGEAVALVGLDLLRRLTEGSQRIFAPAPCQGVLSLEELQRHSHAVAVQARQLARNPDDADAAYVAGLLHDVGKLAIATALPGRDHDSNHAEVGAFLLGILGLPSRLVDAVATLGDPGSTSELVCALRDGHAAAMADLPIAFARLNTAQLLPVR